MSLLKSLNIRYILSVTLSEDLPKFNSQDKAESSARTFKDELVMKHIDINDDPTEDILCHLQGACDWIENSLLSKSKEVVNDSTAPVGVLVHCTQGISRSGSIIVAYCKCGPNLFLIKHSSTAVLSTSLITFKTPAQ